MPKGSQIFVPSRSLGYVSNQVPVQVRYIKSRKENLLVTCVGKAFHTYGVSHFGLLSVSGLHPGDITCLASDTYHVYTSCDNVVYAWRRGTELKHTYRGHTKPVHLILTFGAHLLTVDEGGCVRLWNIKDETVDLELLFSNETFKITAVAHPSTYINKVLFGSEQGGLQLWNVNTSKLIYTFDGWGSAVTCLQQTPALDVVAVGTANGRIVLHNLKFDETVMEFMQDWGQVTAISFRSDDHPIMATGSTLGHITFWNLEERRVASQLLSAHHKSVAGMVCLANEPLLVTSSPDNSLKLWIFDMPDGGARLLRVREGHSAEPTFVRFHGSSGQHVLSAAGDSTLRIFNTRTERFNKNLGRASYNRKASKKKGRTVEDNFIMPPIIEFTSETTREKEWDDVAAIHSGTRAVTLWSYNKVKMSERRLLPNGAEGRDLKADIAATAISLTNCGNFVLVAFNDGYIDRFNMQSGLWRCSYGSPNAHTGPVQGVAVDALNKVVVSGGSDSFIKFWGFKNEGGKPFRTLALDDSVLFFRSHRESSMLLVALVDFTFVIIDIDSRNVIRKFPGHSALLTDGAFSPDARWIVTASMDCVVRTWDVPTSRLIDQFQTESACTAVDMSPTGECIITSHVGHLGVFIWCNRTLYQSVTLKGLDVDAEAPLVELPEFRAEHLEDEPAEVAEDEFVSAEQISEELITLSGLPTSRWQNLLNIDVVRARNKPRAPPKLPKSAPFFLPTLQSLSLQFDLGVPEKAGSKLLRPETVLNLTEFGKLLQTSTETGDFAAVVTKLKFMGPTMVDFEVKSLAVENGGSVEVMLQFLRCIEDMLRSNVDFELAQAYLAVFLKSHGRAIASEPALCDYLPNIQSCLNVGWNRLQEKLMYGLCVVDNLKKQN